MICVQTEAGCAHCPIVLRCWRTGDFLAKSDRDYRGRRWVHISGKGSVRFARCPDCNCVRITYQHDTILCCRLREIKKDPRVQQFFRQIARTQGCCDDCRTLLSASITQYL